MKGLHLWKAGCAGGDESHEEQEEEGALARFVRAGRGCEVSHVPRTEWRGGEVGGVWDQAEPSPGLRET